jgi:hypothetical protein
MANPRPTPKPENLRPPWPKGTSGNPAGYSRGRRISDAIERQIDEMELDREFGSTAIAMALGKKHLLKQKVKDPETCEDVWVEQKPDLAWFKMITQRIEPVAEQTDAVARLRAILDDIDSELPDPIDQGKAAESPERSRCHPCDCNENVEPAEKLFQAEPARVDSGQVALKVLQTLPRAGNLVTSLAVERRIGHRRVPTLRGLLELFDPARHAVQLFAFLEAQVAGLFTGGVRCSLAGNIRIRPRSGGGLRRALAEVVVVAFFLLWHQAVVLDHQRAGAYGVQAGAVLADQQDGSRVVHQERLEQLQGLDAELTPPTPPSQGGEKTSRPNSPPLLAKGGLGGVAGWTFGAGNASENRSDVREVVAQQADAPPATLLTRLTLSVLSPVLAPKGDPDGKPIAGT